MTSSLYVRDGSSFRPTDTENLRIEHELPAGNYTIKHDMKGFFFEPVGLFELPKLYGNTPMHAERILRTFFTRPSTTGVLLSGAKGTGKSQLAKLISARALEANMATFVVNTPLCGDSFNTLVQNITQPAVFLFDEFEKTYNREEQQRLLTLLDGMYPSKKLFVLTVNDMWSVDKHMLNRPGRLFYHLKYGGLSDAEIEGYCQDNLADMTKLEGVKRCASLFAAFSFDLLKAIVEEMNRYSETASEVMKWLNIDPNAGMAEQTYTLRLYTPEGVELPVSHPSRWVGAPFMEGSHEMDKMNVHVNLSRSAEAKRFKLTGIPSLAQRLDDDATLDTYFEFKISQFQAEKSHSGTQVFRNEDGFALAFSPYTRYVHQFGDF